MYFYDISEDMDGWDLETSGMERRYLAVIFLPVSSGQALSFSFHLWLWKWLLFFHFSTSPEREMKLRI
jgi:hypothetical protein